MSAASAILKEKLDQVPLLPGIYKMLDARGDIIYIGKSKCLRKRVKSYFTDNKKWSKIEKLVSLIHDVDYIVTDTHLEARLLECELIKEIKPVFNAQMKNDREYVYLKVENSIDCNALSVVSEREEFTFGPFRNKYTLNEVIDSLKCIFPIVKNNEGYDFDYKVIPVSMEQESYEINRVSLLEVLTDKQKMAALIHILDERMQEAAASFKFETASKFRDIIQGLNYIDNVIWRYKEMMSQDILLKIPAATQGYKLFFISNGNIVLKKYCKALADEDIKSFIESAYSMSGLLSKPEPVEQDEKAGIDFRDILYSEITSLPEEMVIYLGKSKVSAEQSVFIDI